MGLFDTNLDYYRNGLLNQSYGDYYATTKLQMLAAMNSSSASPMQIPVLQKPETITKQQKLLLLETL